MVTYKAINVGTTNAGSRSAREASRRTYSPAAVLGSEGIKRGSSLYLLDMRVVPNNNPLAGVSGDGALI